MSVSELLKIQKFHFEEQLKAACAMPATGSIKFHTRVRVITGRLNSAAAAAARPLRLAT